MGGKRAEGSLLNNDGPKTKNSYTHTHTGRSPNITSQQRSDEARGKEQRGSLNAKPYCGAVGVCIYGI